MRYGSHVQDNPQRKKGSSKLERNEVGYLQFIRSLWELEIIVSNYEAILEIEIAFHWQKC